MIFTLGQQLKASNTNYHAKNCANLSLGIKYTSSSAVRCRPQLHYVATITKNQSIGCLQVPINWTSWRRTSWSLVSGSFAAVSYRCDSSHVKEVQKSRYESDLSTSHDNHNGGSHGNKTPSMCRIPCHDHAWKDCPENRRSKDWKGFASRSQHYDDTLQDRSRSAPRNNRRHQYANRDRDTV